jgi:hypothetical protein
VRRQRLYDLEVLRRQPTCLLDSAGRDARRDRVLVDVGDVVRVGELVWDVQSVPSQGERGLVARPGERCVGTCLPGARDQLGIRHALDE